MSEQKVRYAEICKRHYVPLQLQPWWLDAVCGQEHWDVCLARNGSGQIIGALPYCCKKHFFGKTIVQPPLTSYGGPWFFIDPEKLKKPGSRYQQEYKVLEELIRQLPPTVFYRQNFHPDIKNWLPFFWDGFRETTRYTYQFDHPGDLEKIETGFKNTLRTDLKKAGRSVEAHRQDDAIDAVFRVHEQSFLRQNKRPPYTLEVCRRLNAALLQRGQVACWLALDRHSGEPHAGLCVAYDTRRAGILLTGTDPAHKSASAIWLLFWEAIVFCLEKNLSLDFEGSMDRNIERGFRAFGADLVPYHSIWRPGNRVLDIAYRLIKQ